MALPEKLLFHGSGTAETTLPTQKDPHINADPLIFGDVYTISTTVRASPFGCVNEYCFDGRFDLDLSRFPVSLRMPREMIFFRKFRLSNSFQATIS